MTTDDMLDALFPERACVRAGDPFVTRIVMFDDQIARLVTGARLLGPFARHDAELVHRVERERVAYEIGLLCRWARHASPGGTR